MHFAPVVGIAWVLTVQLNAERIKSVAATSLLDCTAFSRCSCTACLHRHLVHQPSKLPARNKTIAGNESLFLVYKRYNAAFGLQYSHSEGVSIQNMKESRMNTLSLAKWHVVDAKSHRSCELRKCHAYSETLLLGPIGSWELSLLRSPAQWPWLVKVALSKHALVDGTKLQGGDLAVSGLVWIKLSFGDCQVHDSSCILVNTIGVAPEYGKTAS